MLRTTLGFLDAKRAELTNPQSINPLMMTIRRRWLGATSPARSTTSSMVARLGSEPGLTLARVSSAPPAASILSTWQRHPHWPHSTLCRVELGLGLGVTEVHGRHIKRLKAKRKKEACASKVAQRRARRRSSRRPPPGAWAAQRAQLRWSPGQSGPGQQHADHGRGRPGQ